MHRRSARVVGAAGEAKLRSALPCNCFDHSQRSSEIPQDRSLFDMKFNVTQNVILQGSCGDLRSIQSEVLNCLADGNSVHITAGAKLGRGLTPWSACVT